DVQPTIPTAVREPTDPHSPVRVDVVQIGGEGEPVRSAYGYTDTSGWNQQFVGVRTLRVMGRLADGSGVAWFDDLSLSPLFPHPWRAVRGAAGAADGPVRTVD